MISEADGRNYGCRITEGMVYRGMRTIVMQNEVIRLSILVDKGSDVFELLYKPRDIDFLWRSPIGIQNPYDTRSSQDSFEDFMSSYHGGWQEIFPSGSGSSVYKGISTGFHGEAASLKWDYEILRDTPDVIEVMLKVKTKRTPFTLKKKIRLESNKSILFIEENVKNDGNVDLAFMWGHHPSFGSPFLSSECILTLPYCEMKTQTEQGSNNRLSANQTFNWPYALDVEGKNVDLRNIPSIESKSTDMLYAKFLEESWYALTNKRSQVGIGFVWPKEMFPYLWVWQEFGGNLEFPWYGQGYTMALEPFTSLPDKGENGLDEAIRNGTASYISANEEVNKEFKVVIFESDHNVKNIEQTGKVNYYDNREGALQWTRVVEK